jgi:hypothetical protein
MGHEFRALAPQVGAAPQVDAGGAPLGWVDIGLGEHTTAEQSGKLLSLALGVFRFTAMHGFHIAGMAQDKGNALVGTQVGEPGPGDETRDGHDEAGPLRGHGFEHRFGSRLHVAVAPDGAILTQEADIHGAGMHVDATVKWVLLGVASH